MTNSRPTGEKGVEFSQMGALAGHLLFDRFDDGSETALEVDGGSVIRSRFR